MRTAVLALALSVVPMTSACNRCFDDGQDTSCPRGDGYEVRAEKYEPWALSEAGDHFVALISYFNNLDGSVDSARWLVELDRSGSVLEITETDLLAPAPLIAADGHGSTLVVHDNGAQFLRDGLEIHKARLDGDATAAYSAGVYWVAVASTQRQLLRFDANGMQLTKTAYPDERRAEDPSLATDPLGDGIAAGWRLTSTYSVLVERLRNDLVTELELAPDPSLASQRPWASPVAMRDGVVAVVFGSNGTGSIVLMSATDQITRKAVAVPATCSGTPSFIGTPAGYLLHCDSHFILFDATGTPVADDRAPFDARLAVGRGAALAIGSQSANIETRDVSNTVAEPTVVFEGESHDVDGGCSTTRPSGFWLVVLALVLVPRRRSRV